ncbi:MAG TPA: metal-dependent hydrolase [Burkholderiaceae bacterium]|nr:metal-dependent hydrolase [Burkholderiaceae bacterium]
MTRYPESHDVFSDGALCDYVAKLKSRCMRNAGPIAKVVYDSRLHLVQQALGTHTTVSRVQGGNLKAKRENPYRRPVQAGALAHLKEREHGKPFYALCTLMEPSYHQLEFDVRLWLSLLELAKSAGDRAAGGSPAA